MRDVPEISWAAMDPYPRVSAADTRLHAFWAALAEDRLTTTRCTDCGEMAWPPRVVCPACLSEALEWTDLPATGRVAGTTLQPVGLPPGFDAPALFALVDVGPVRCFTRILADTAEAAAAVQVGDEVALTTIEVPPAPGDKEARPRLLPAFRPVEVSGS